MKLEVKIKKILYTDTKSSYRIFRGQIISKELKDSEKIHDKAIQKVMTFKGNMTYCSEGDSHSIDATLKREKSGMVLYVNSSALKKIELENELEHYLTKHVKGVGKKTAKKIMDTLKVNAIDVIKSDEGVQKLTEIIGSKKLATSIRGHIIMNANVFAVMEFLQLHNLPVNIANEILDEYGNDGLIELQDNPYFFIRCISFNELDAIAKKKTQIDAKDINRIGAGVVAIVNDNTKNKKHICTRVEDIYNGLQDYINTNGCYEVINLSKEEITSAIEFVLESNMLAMENGEFLYINYLRNKENDVAYHIRRLNKQCKKVSTKDILKALEEVEKECKIKASNEQQDAVIKAIQYGISVLTGLPGSGKTFTVNLTVKVYQKLFPDNVIKQIAPTGKASKRMTEVTGLSAETIHRALKINEFTNKAEELEGDFIIIDEASMLDMYLSGTLFSNIKDNTKVLIVGDIEQLPSLGAGAVLKDIIESEVVPVTRLTKLFRQAESSNIVTNAHAIAKETYDFDWSGDSIFWQSAGIEESENNIIKCYKRFLELGNSRSRIGLLSPRKTEALSSHNINKIIQENFNVGSKGIVVNATGDVIKEKDLVMQVENNYDIEVFNGETGMVERIEVQKDEYGDAILDAEGKKKHIIYVKYPNKDEAIPYDADMYKELDLAYCISIHKSQGSEYDAVMVVVNKAHEMMLDRNLIYTAMTRAKKLLVMLGDKETFEIAIKKKDASNRLSNLKEKLQGKQFTRGNAIKVPQINDTFNIEDILSSLELRQDIDFDNNEINIIGYDEDGTEIF